MIGLERETQNDIPPPLAIQPTDSTDDLIIMRDHQHKVDDMTSLGRRQSSRKRGSPHFFVPTPFRSSPRLHGHCLRRGPGRPPQRRSDAEISAHNLCNIALVVLGERHQMRPQMLQR